ncbi:MAG: aminoglycoside phosphotransferase family protein, partial [Atopobium minutum]|nr:aminoglycoside phosphotransferase family protein [Atopobium minutum]
MELSNNKQEIVRRGNKVVWDCGDSIVKAFNSSKPASDVLNEALNLTRVYEAGVKAPQFIEVSALDDGWALKTQRVEGTMLSTLMDENPTKLAEYLSNFVELQLDIQSHAAALLPRQRDKFARMINSLSCINATTRYDLLVRLDGMKVEEKICHGDFNPTNVLVQEDGSCTVVDWAHATQGAPAADVAMSYMLFSFEDQKLA